MFRKEGTERESIRLRGSLPGGLDELLHDDVVFYSPVVFTAQRGKAITKLYLQAAQATFPGDASERDGGNGAEGAAGSFRYVKQILSENQAVLEFETRMDGVVVNGVDLITCDAEGRIVAFKVMIRPLRAVNADHGRMRARHAGVPRREPRPAREIRLTIGVSSPRLLP